jgi:hypothetical protein
VVAIEGTPVEAHHGDRKIASDVRYWPKAVIHICDFDDL